jgi:hypothetical protein
MEMRKMRRGIEEKEQEITATISQTKSLLALIIPREEVLENCKETKKDSQPSETETCPDLKVTAEEETVIAAVAEMKIQQSKELFIATQQSLESRLRNVITEYDFVFTGIRNCAQELIDLNLSTGKKEEFEHLVEKKAFLEETRSHFEKELSARCVQYCEMSETLLGRSFQESNLVLQSIREDRNNSSAAAAAAAGSSPFLQKYAEVVKDLQRTEEEINEVTTQMSNFQVDETEQQITILNEKVSEFHARQLQLAEQIKELREEIGRCGSKIRTLWSPAFYEDLIAAMKWSVLESEGLYEPSRETAALVLLLYRQSKERGGRWEEGGREDVGKKGMWIKTIVM